MLTNGNPGTAQSADAVVLKHIFAFSIFLLWVLEPPFAFASETFLEHCELKAQRYEKREAVSDVPMCPFQMEEQNDKCNSANYQTNEKWSIN